MTTTLERVDALLPQAQPLATAIADYHSRLHSYETIKAGKPKTSRGWEAWDAQLLAALDALALSGNNLKSLHKHYKATMAQLIKGKGI